MYFVPASQYSIQELTDAYNQTRVDYIVPMPMSAKRLQDYVDTYDISLEDSVVTVDESEEMLGLSMLGVREGRSWITRLGVLPTSRRGGIGRKMMEYMIERSKKLGLKHVFLEVITGNEPAYNLFQSLGFVEQRELLILRRPPRQADAFSALVEPGAKWLDEAETLNCLATRPWRAAWTNQAESVHNAGGVRLLHISDSGGEDSGWVTYQKSMLQLKRVMLSPDGSDCKAPAHKLLSLLHKQFPALDTIAENVPANAPFLDAYFDNDYVESFRRIEMLLTLD